MWLGADFAGLPSYDEQTPTIEQRGISEAPQIAAQAAAPDVHFAAL
jgi:hypothetical protein